MSTPQANAAAPTAPNASAAPQAPPPAIGNASLVQGAVQPAPAPAPRRSRAPRGPVSAPSHSAPSGAPALLEIAAALPMYTHQRREANFFAPDAHMLFHVLGICDGMMNGTHRFTQSAPAWIPIVSQLYISVLWLAHILTVYVNSGYAPQFTNILRDMIEYLRIDECLVPGPLVPFFEALAAANGPFDWIGDVVAGLAEIQHLLDAGTNVITQQHMRQVPCPAYLLDQLHYFGTYNLPAGQNRYTHFEWTRNIFTAAGANLNDLPRYRMGPQSTGSLHTTEAQFNSAYTFWNAFFTGQNRSNGQVLFMTRIEHFLGFVNDANYVRVDWFQQVSIVMGKYAQYFNGSRPLKSISPSGLGACLIQGRPRHSVAMRDWIYPNGFPAPFTSHRFQPIRAIPTGARFDFLHSDHELEEVAEQYAILTHTNIDWSRNITAQHGWNAILQASHYTGDIWAMTPHRQADAIEITRQFGQIIASRYHQVTALKSE